MKRATVQDRSDGTPDPDRVQGFDEPALGRRAPSEEHVGAAVEQDHDGDVRDPTPRLLEMKVEADGHPAHVADLHVGDHEVRRILLDRWPHVLAGTQLADFGLVVLKGRSQLLEN